MYLRTALTSLCLALIFLSACTAPTEPSLRSDVTGLESSELFEGLIARKSGDAKVSLCHFPPGNPGNRQIVSVSGQAADAHLRNHAGDGIVGRDYDENCDPLPTCSFVDFELANYVYDLGLNYGTLDVLYDGTHPIILELTLGGPNYAYYDNTVRPSRWSYFYRDDDGLDETRRSGSLSAEDLPEVVECFSQALAWASDRSDIDVEVRRRD